MTKEERVGKRKRRETFKKRVPDLGYYYVVVDTTATEENFFFGLRKTIPDEFKERLVIKVSHATTNKLVSTCKDKVAMESQYREPWIVFDRDEVPEFDNIIKLAENNGINVGWPNPCIELWFEAYFGAIGTYDKSVLCCHKFSEKFKKKTGVRYKKSDKKYIRYLIGLEMKKKQLKLLKKSCSRILKMELKNHLRCVPAQRYIA